MNDIHIPQFLYEGLEITDSGDLRGPRTNNLKELRDSEPFCEMLIPT